MATSGSGLISKENFKKIFSSEILYTFWSPRWYIIQLISSFYHIYMYFGKSLNLDSSA